MELKICEYCNTPFIGRTNKLFCNIKCKRNQNKRNQRETKRVEKEREHIRSLVRQFRESDINPTMVALYNKIYNK